MGHWMDEMDLLSDAVRLNQVMRARMRLWDELWLASAELEQAVIDLERRAEELRVRVMNLEKVLGEDQEVMG